MTAAKFKVGQMVCLKAAVRDAAAGKAVGYKILRLLHQQGRDWSYLVKTILERDARFAEQDELMLLSALWSSSVTTLPEKIPKG
jgi:hypothetical protein